MVRTTEKPARQTRRAVFIVLSKGQPVEVETAGLGVGGLVFDQGEVGHLILHTRLFLKGIGAWMRERWHEGVCSVAFEFPHAIHVA